MKNLPPIFEIVAICSIILAIINGFLTRRAFNKFRNYLFKTSELQNFELIDDESDIKIIGLEQTLLLVCKCGSKSEILGRHLKCHKCHKEVTIDKSLMNKLYQLSDGIGTLTGPEVDKIIS